MNDSDPGAVSFYRFGIFVQPGESQPADNSAYTITGLCGYGLPRLRAYD